MSDTMNQNQMPATPTADDQTHMPEGEAHEETPMAPMGDTMPGANPAPTGMPSQAPAEQPMGEQHPMGGEEHQEAPAMETPAPMAPAGEEHPMGETPAEAPAAPEAPTEHPA